MKSWPVEVGLNIAQNHSWDGAQDYELDKLDQVHIRAMRIITGATERSSIQRLYM